jgi:predicted outer membrane repeat protein
MFTHLRCAAALALSIAALTFAETAAAFIVYKVGAAANCPYHTIQEAIDAAGANPGEDLVWIAHDQPYSNQEIFITDQDVDVTGGFDDCDDIDPASDTTTLVGNGNGGAAVFTIRGTSHVFLGNLQINGAHRNDDASGGGIDFDGEGWVQTQYLSVGLNSAGYGGGINMKGEGAGATLELLHDTVFINNTASTSGGGIRLEGNARLLALQPSTLITINHALGGYGGGIEVLGPARADIGSPGYANNAVIQFNDAEYGGGIAAIAIDSDTTAAKDAIVRLFTTDPTHPVSVSSNTASHTGGAIYLKPLYGVSASAAAVLCASEFVFYDNIAQEGTAIYSDAEYDFLGLGEGGSIYLNTDDSLLHYCTLPEPPESLGAVDCSPGAPCNIFSANIAEDGAAVPTDGSTILLQDGSILRVNRMSMRANRGGHLIRNVNGWIAVRNCLLAGNDTTQEPIAQTDGGDRLQPLSFDSCTIADNQIGAAHVISAPFGLNLTDSIIAQPGIQTVVPDITDPTAAAFVLTNDRSTLPDTVYIEQGEPTFVDAAAGDYHLQSESLGVDNAPALNGLDLDGNPRVVDLPAVPDNFGPMDLGAYENQSGSVIMGCGRDDTVFCDGFDDGAG